VVSTRVKIEIRSKDEFWGRAFHVEWEDQFRDRELVAAGEGHYLAEPEWLDDLTNVAGQTFCRVVLAPDSPARRKWLTMLGGRR
jgi:hypothetical protein